MESRVLKLKQKAQELREQAEQWAKQNDCVGPGECIVLSLEITSKPAVFVIDKSSSLHYTRNTDKALTDKDWQAIFSLPFGRKYMAILSLLRENNNEPLSCKAVEKELSKTPEFSYNPFLTCSQTVTMNAIFSKACTPYRIKQERKKMDEERYKIFIIE